MITQKKCVGILAAVFLFAGGCAPKNYSFEEEGAYDPLERINRGVYGVNKTIDAFLFRPLAQAYDKMPTVIKDRFDNFFYNLGEPSNIVNNTLQKQINAAAWSASRLVFNTTLGVGGLFDVSDKMGIKRQPADFGQTIRAYAGSGGAYLVLPLVGPSSLADAPGLAVDAAMSPLFYVKKRTLANSANGVNFIRIRASYLEESKLAEETALDEYSFVRDIREEQRSRDVPEDVWGK